jgi:hypothetical protein
MAKNTKGKKIVDTLKKAIGVTNSLETNIETVTQLCWDAVNVKCIAIENKDGKLIRHHPPSLTKEQILEAEKGGSITIVAFK